MGKLGKLSLLQEAKRMQKHISRRIVPPKEPKSQIDLRCCMWDTGTSLYKKKIARNNFGYSVK